MNHLIFSKALATILIIAFVSCKKKTSEICGDGNTNARIIGYDPCRDYVSWGKIEGAGFVIELDRESVKDTVVTYTIPEGLFSFLPGYIDYSYSSFLFRPEVQQKFPIRLNYRYAENSEKTKFICNGMVNTGPYDKAVKGKEIFGSCITAR